MIIPRASPITEISSYTDVSLYLESVRVDESTKRGIFRLRSGQEYKMEVHHVDSSRLDAFVLSDWESVAESVVTMLVKKRFLSNDDEMKAFNGAHITSEGIRRGSGSDLLKHTVPTETAEDYRKLAAYLLGKEQVPPSPTDDNHASASDVDAIDAKPTVADTDIDEAAADDLEAAITSDIDRRTSARLHDLVADQMPSVGVDVQQLIDRGVDNRISVHAVARLTHAIIVKKSTKNRPDLKSIYSHEALRKPVRDAFLRHTAQYQVQRVHDFVAVELQRKRHLKDSDITDIVVAAQKKYTIASTDQAVADQLNRYVKASVIREHIKYRLSQQ